MAVPRDAEQFVYNIERKGRSFFAIRFNTKSKNRFKNTSDGAVRALVIRVNFAEQKNDDYIQEKGDSKSAASGARRLDLFADFLRIDKWEQQSDRNQQ
ncbi:hypothetical protein L5515_005486 [Caenorhabditis briggsae]|uniref:Uncharacterized protein n=1 Tax=Caenorhabditis briggsae TaxID=6238 RepID=A0AAE9EQA8_CAEBR|nr:hypothetical protein L5515_005486 [Caenorhabditis briggsae]